MLGAPREIVDACANQPTSLANVPACELERDEGRVMVVKSLSVTKITELARMLCQPIGNWQLHIDCKTVRGGAPVGCVRSRFPRLYLDFI